MKVVTFSREGKPAVGIVKDGEILAPEGFPGDIGELLIQEGLDGLRELGRRSESASRFPLGSVRLLAPIERPRKVVCAGLNYRGHAAEAGLAVPTRPVLFMRAVSSLTGPGHPIERPLCSETLDYEAELAVVVGKKARHLSLDTALDVVAGYTCFNDGSVREYQRHAATMTSGKNFDLTGGFGPWIVTPDELPDGAANLRIEARLNGRTVQSSTTSELIFDVPALLVYISTCMTLEPGDVIATGTPAGVGALYKPPLWMRHGDVIEVEIEGIGTLLNTVRDEEKILHT